MTRSFKKTAKQEQATKILAGDAIRILLHGGSRSGKTFIFIRAIVIRAAKAPESRHVILRYRFNHVKQSIWYDTFPKVMSMCFPELKYYQNKSDWFVELPNKSQIWFGGLDDKERTEKILGNEYSTIFFNECSQISYESITTALTRLAQKTRLINRAYFDCNPPSKKHWAYSLFIEGLDPISKEKVDQAMYAQLQLNPMDNLDNLPPGYIENTLGGLPDRQRKRFRDGIWLEDNERALWKRWMIDNFRIPADKLPNLQKICISIDPAVTAKPESDDTGIISCASGPAPGIPGVKYPELTHYYVIHDLTLKGSPYEWGKTAIEEYQSLKADRIIGEVNNGGDLIEMNLRNINPNIPFTSIHATRGKMVRAEPVSGLYEQGRVHHVEILPDLEDEMCDHEFTTTDPSPNRLDAMVWGISYLAGFGKARVEAPEIDIGELGL